MTTARDTFLEQVAASLPLPDEVARATIEELAGHLADGVADRVAHGTPIDIAEAEAVAQLGSPSALAHGLARAHRGRTQLLAAAGAGTWATVRTGVLASFVVGLLLALASVVATVGLRAAAGWLGVQIQVNWAGGWYSVLTAAGFGVGALLGGTAAVKATARAGWRRPIEVRSAVLVVGCLAVGWLVLVAFEATLNWASVIALLLVPVAFGAGAWRSPIGTPSLRATRPALVVGLVFVVTVSLGVAVTSDRPLNYQWDESTVGYEVIGPWWQDQASGQAMDFVSGSSGWSVPGLETLTVEAATPEAAAQFHDYRLEAWRAEPPHDNWRLVPGQTAPFAMADASVDGPTVSGTIRFNQMPGVDWAVVAMTAIGPDGRRYLLAPTGPPTETQFLGSVWSWFSALAGSLFESVPA